MDQQLAADVGELHGVARLEDRAARTSISSRNEEWSIIDVDGHVKPLAVGAAPVGHESKQRQYALADRAVALGWSRAAVEIIDKDQGKSGASTQGRDGFARLAHDVAHGKVGAILAVEVSRLARSSQDWQRLLSLCAVAHVVVIDEKTVYDPSNRDDKLLPRSQGCDVRAGAALARAAAGG